MDKSRTPASFWTDPSRVIQVRPPYLRQLTRRRSRIEVIAYLLMTFGTGLFAGGILGDFWK